MVRPRAQSKVLLLAFSLVRAAECKEARYLEKQVVVKEIDCEEKIGLEASHRNLAVRGIDGTASVWFPGSRVIASDRR